MTSRFPIRASISSPPSQVAADHPDPHHLRRYCRHRPGRLEGRGPRQPVPSPTSARWTPSPMSSAASRTVTSPMSRQGRPHRRYRDHRETELMLADLESLEKRVVSLERRPRAATRRRRSSRPDQPRPRPPARWPPRPHDRGEAGGGEDLRHAEPPHHQAGALRLQRRGSLRRQGNSFSAKVFERAKQEGARAVVVSRRSRARSP